MPHIHALYMVRYRFNSSLVLLKAAAGRLGKRRVGQRGERDLRDVFHCFNSSLVLLKVALFKALPPLPRSFNSSLVLLKDGLAADQLADVLERGFNSSLVLLKESAQAAPDTPHSRFNSSLVLLKGKSKPTPRWPSPRSWPRWKAGRRPSIHTVSIPAWFY